MSIQDRSSLFSDPDLRDVPVIEGFKVLEPAVLYARIGGGGMGSVYRGRHFKFDMDVAVKCLKPALAQEDPQLVARFQREARIAAGINHQNLVHVMDVNEKAGVNYLVMEFVRGETARERVARKGRLPTAEALAIVLGAARGLAEAHGRGIVHRDIKPDNIMVAVEGVVKVADLGLAKASDGSAGEALTSRAIMGTPQYMPPEQWEDLSLVGPPADVWALGATLYFLLVGDEANPRRSTAELCRLICDRDFPSLAGACPGIEPRVADLVAWCTRRPPRERPPDARTVLRELRKLVDEDTPVLHDPETGLGTTRLGTPTPPPKDTLARIRRAVVGSEPALDPATVVQAAFPATRRLPPDPATEAEAAPAASRTPVRRRGALLAGGGAALVLASAASWWFLSAGGAGPSPEPVQDPRATAATPPAEATPAQQRERLERSLKWSEPAADAVVSGTAIRVAGRVEQVGEVELALAAGDATPAWAGARRVPVVDGVFRAELTASAEGPTTVWLRLAAQPTPILSQRRVRVDFAEPELTVQEPAENSTVGRTVEVRGTASDSAGLRAVTVDGRPAELRDGRFRCTLELSHGRRVVEVVARDVHDRTRSMRRTLQVDGEGPAFRELRPADGSITSAPQTHITGRLDDTRATLQVGATPVPVDGGGGFDHVVTLSEGQPNRLELCARDALGNETRRSLTLVRDSTPPELRWTEPAAAAQDEAPASVRPGRLRLAGAVRDASRTTVAVNDRAATVAEGRWQVELEIADQQRLEVRVVARDAAGLEAVLSRTLLGQNVNETPKWGSQLGRTFVDVGGGRSLAREVRDPRTSTDFMLIPPGEFLMGSPSGVGDADERPQHRVQITKPFYLGKHEVTQRLWVTIMGTHPYRQKYKGDNRPMESVRWEDVRAFLQSEQLGPGYRLPTEAEWEYACKAPIKGRAWEPSATDIEKYAYLSPTRPNAYNQIKEAHTTVGLKLPNPFGLHDMLGNVREWVADVYDAGLYARRGGFVVDPPAQGGSGPHVTRGGAYDNTAANCRPSERFHPDDKHLHNVGFRLARDP